MADQAPTNVNVVNPNGELVSIDPKDLASAVNYGGYRVPEAGESQELLNKAKYGTAGNAVVAGAESALGTATGGISRELENASGYTTPQDQANRAKYNPIASDVVGPAVGITGALLAPELEGMGAIGEAANPVKAVSKLSGAVSEAAAPFAEGAARLVANPETSPIVNKIVSKAISTGAGSAVEGAAYGLGQAVNEDAMGNPEALGDKLMSHIGYNALMFGGMGAGLGGILGAYSGATEKYVPGFLSSTDKAAVAAGDFKASIKASDLPESEKNGIFASLGEQKETAPEIKGAAERLGAPVMEGQTSASSFVQRGEDALLNGAPTYEAIQRKALYKQGYDIANNAVESTVADTSSMSAREAGEALKESLAQKIKNEADPINQIYDGIKEHYQAIPLSERSTPSISRNILKLDEVRISPSSPEAKLAQRVADEIPNLKTVEDVKQYKSILNRSISPTASSGEKRMVAILSDKLTDLEENSIVRFAKNEMKTPQAKEKILGLLEQRETANAAYKVFRDKLEGLADALGKRRVYGAHDFLDFLENNVSAEKVADKLFTKKDSALLDQFAKNFPDEMQIMRKYQRGLIRDAALKTGEFNPKAVFNKLDGFSKEIKNHLFSPEELQKLEDARTYLRSFPKSFNPSGTDHTSAFRAFFEHPTSALIANARDYGIAKFVKAAGRLDPDGAAKVAGLAQLERTAQKQSQSIATSAKAIFSVAGKAALPASAVLAVTASKRDEHKDLIDKIDRLNANPSNFIDHLDERTRSLYSIAPKTAGAVQQTAIRATQFLSGKAPKEQQAGPMSRKLPPSQADLSKFNLYFQTVENPTDVLKHVAAGTLTPEHLETLSTVYPTLFSEMKSTVMEHLMDHMAKPEFELPYKKRQALAMFLGQDLDGSLNPQSIQTNQMAMQTMGSQQAKQDMQAQAKVTQGGLKGINAGSRMLTAMQSNSQRENA